MAPPPFSLMPLFLSFPPTQEWTTCRQALGLILLPSPTQSLGWACLASLQATICYLNKIRDTDNKFGCKGYGGRAWVCVKILTLDKNRFKTNDKCLKRTLFLPLKHPFIFFLVRTTWFSFGELRLPSPVACPLGQDNHTHMETELRQNKDKNCQWLIPVATYPLG